MKAKLKPIDLQIAADLYDAGQVTTAINLLTGDVLTFDKYTTPEWAVVYAYCQDNNLSSELFSSAQNNTVGEFYKKMPLAYGKKTVTCGNWAVRVE